MHNKGIIFTIRVVITNKVCIITYNNNAKGTVKMTNPVYTNRKFGIEVEFVGANLGLVAEAINNAGVPCQFERYNHFTRDYWKITTDASLASAGGYAGELVSPILEGSEGVAELEKVLQALNAIDGVTINRSCGLHVHLDSRDMSMGEIAKVFTRYSQYEAQIDLGMPRSRRGEPRWCRSITASNIVETVTNASTKQQGGRALGRYHKVNLSNINERGSIEFRHHSGTTEFHKISNWLSFLMQFVETSIQLANAVEPRTANRWFSKPRALIEANGYEVRHIRFSENWKITFEGREVMRLSNEDFENLYPEGSSQKNGEFNAWSLIRAFETQDLDLNEFPTATTTTDTGWLMGICQTVANYLAERTLELN